MSMSLLKVQQIERGNIKISSSAKCMKRRERLEREYVTTSLVEKL